MADEKRCSDESRDAPVGFWLVLSVTGCLLGFVVGLRLSPFTALVVSCLVGSLLGWWLRCESDALEDHE
jgi:hypothetical protein